VKSPTVSRPTIKPRVKPTVSRPTIKPRVKRYNFPKPFTPQQPANSAHTTKDNPEEAKVEKSQKEMQKMMATTFVGTLLSALALYSLASPDGGGSLLDLFSDGGVDGEEAESAMRFFSSENVGAFLSSLRASSGNVASVALPGAPSDIAALTLGEGVSGFVSSTLVFQVKNYMMRMMKKETSNDSARNLSNGYSNGEYFAARGLAQGLGVPALGSVLFAVIPSTFAKMDERIKNKREINDKLMDELLEGEQCMMWTKDIISLSSLITNLLGQTRARTRTPSEIF